MPTDPPSILKSIPAAVDASLANVPAGKQGVVVMGLEWKYGLPFATFGTALKVGDRFKLAAAAETRFSKLSTSARAFAVWTWLLLLALWLPVPAFAQPAIYPARLVRVVDGDTFILRVELGFDVSYTATIRLADLDTPERFTLEGRRAAAAAEGALKSGPITVAPTGKMTFARHVAHVYVGGKKLAEILEAAGHRKR